MRGLLRRGLVVATASAALPAHAVVVQYDLVPLGDSNFRYVYTVTNDGSLGDAAIGLFDVMFDPLDYDEASLTVTTQAPLAADWDELLLASAPNVSAAYDALAVAGGIANGQAASGFRVDFVWLGTDPPGSQPFVIFDPVSFAVLEEGVTVSPVPAPAAGWLMISGFAALFKSVATRKKRVRIVG